MKFRLEDLVYVSKKGNRFSGKIGRVKHFGKDGQSYAENIGVEFEEPINGHDLGGHCLKPYGYYMRSQDLEKLEPLSVMFQKEWKKEWAPKLKEAISSDPIILLED